MRKIAVSVIALLVICTGTAFASEAPASLDVGAALHLRAFEPVPAFAADVPQFVWAAPQNAVWLDAMNRNYLIVHALALNSPTMQRTSERVNTASYGAWRSRERPSIVRRT